MCQTKPCRPPFVPVPGAAWRPLRSEEHTSELQSQSNLVCRLLLAKEIATFMLEDRMTRAAVSIHQHPARAIERVRPVRRASGAQASRDPGNLIEPLLEP